MTTTRFAPRHASCRLFVSLWLLLTCTATATDPLADGLTPHPQLTPTEVVRIQLEALRHNDDADRGIAVAYRFASPNNQRNTGPLRRFAHMIRNGPYALMLGFSDVLYAPLKLSGRSAAQQVTLTSPGRAPVTYVFHLSKQQAPGALFDCWMTDAVSILPFAGSHA